MLSGALVVLSLAACSPQSPIAGDVTAPTTSPSGPAPAPVDPDLARFYAQDLRWEPCDGGECARFEVPVDYDDPSGPTLEIAVLRRVASGESRGALVVNPGGPGSSGVSYARAADIVVSDVLREDFDIVGFDPRGVGASAPVECLADAEVDALISTDGTPDSPAEIADIEAASTVVDCESTVPGLMENMSTIDAARDLDVLRAALDQERLDYLGVSYGTHLGATYAALFPDRVGRFVLDGPLPAALDAEELALGQAQGFEDALRRFVADCLATEGCPLGSGADVESGMQRLREILEAVDAQPAPTDDPARPLTEAAATYAILLSLYRVGDRPLLRDALASLASGDGTPLQRMLDERAGRNGDGTYRDNSFDAFYAVSCRDRAVPREVALSVDRFIEAAPFLGEYFAWGNLPCAGTPFVGPTRFGAPVPAMLVIATTHDPATPFMWADEFVAQFDDAVLLVREGDGHTAYREGSACVDEAVDGFMRDGALPEPGTVCD